MRLVEKLSANAAQFDPKYADHFVCPTCLRAVPTGELSSISEGHIVPRHAGGKLITLICKRCNTEFGSRQDKWFGEYLRLRAMNGSVFDTQHQTRKFEIAGERVGGFFRRSEDGSIDFFIHTDATHPGALTEVKRKCASGAVESVEFEVPLMANRHLISVGALTATYLMWFRLLGYSWVLQNHLDPVRTFIRDPERAPFAKNYVVLSRTAFFENPCVGVGRLGGELVMFGAVGNHIVLFPPADRQDFYAALPTDFAGVSMSDLDFFGSDDRTDFNPPHGLLYVDRALVMPDAMRSRTVRAPFLFFPRKGGPPRFLYQIPKEEFERRRMLPGSTHMKIGARK